MTNGHRLRTVAVAVLVTEAISLGNAAGVTGTKYGEGGGWVRKILVTC